MQREILEQHDTDSDKNLLIISTGQKSWENQRFMHIRHQKEVVNYTANCLRTEE